MAGRRSVARWRGWREWQDVHEGLFSGDIDAQQRAVSRVSAWRSRGDVPVSVNATAQLVEIAIHEHMADHQHHAIAVSARSHMELSLVYASAIVRCVNGLVDGSQKGAYAMAVSTLAQRIGIPLWIVDLRHESTHNQLPSLPVLRFAATHLLAWLRSNYWYKQEGVIRGHVRHTAEVLVSRLPLLNKNQGEAGDVELAPLKDALDVEKLRENVVPLLVDGYQYGEQLFPVGALFLGEYLPQADPGTPVSEAETLSAYPKSDLTVLLLELQSIWVGLSASLLAALCQKVMSISQSPVDQVNHAELEVSLFWIKLLVSNEWREKLKYAEEPIEDIYRSGASMVALIADRAPREPPTVSVLERLRTLLRACKGVRTHSIVIKDTVVRKELGALTTEPKQWTQLSDWNPSPLGLLNGFVRPETETPMEFSLEIDQEASLMFTASPIDVDAGHDEDDAIDQLMESLDAEYDHATNEMRALQQRVHDHVVQGSSSNHGGNQKVLPQQEVERIQNEIEIW
jgi:hypothetical protein